MAIGGVNISQTGGLPINVKFQLDEPVDKTGIWVKREFNKHPKIVIGSFNPTPLGVKAFSIPNLTYQMASIETDNYYVFFTKGRQQLNYSGYRVIAISKLDRVVTSTTFYNNESTFPVSIGDVVYFPLSNRVLMLDVATMQYTQINVTDLGGTLGNRSIYHVGDFLHVFVSVPGFYPQWFKINISNNYQVTEMPRLPTTSMPLNPALNKEGLFPFYDERNGNLLTYFNSENGQLIATPYPLNRNIGGNMLYYDRNKKYIIFGGNDGLYYALNAETGEFINLGITRVVDPMKVRESFPKTKNTTFYSRYGNNHRAEIHIHEYDVMDIITDTMLIIETTDFGGYGTSLISLDATDTKFEIKVADAKLIVNEELVTDDIIYIGNGIGFTKLEKLEVKSDG